MALFVDDRSQMPVHFSLADELNQQPADANRPVSSYVHHQVRVAPSPMQGLGLFASGPINEGEVVAWEYADLYQGPNDNRPGKKIMTWAQIEERWPDKRERDIMVAYSYQIGEDAFLIPLREDDLVITTYQNHSCDPNTWWADDFTLVARKTILPGEEITFDYSTSESLDNPEMPECHCGSSLCRRRLDPLDYLNPDLVDRYGSHFVSYLLDRQRRHFESQAAKSVAIANNNIADAAVASSLVVNTPKQVQSELQDDEVVIDTGSDDALEQSSEAAQAVLEAQHDEEGCDLDASKFAANAHKS